MQLHVKELDEGSRLGGWKAAAWNNHHPRYLKWPGNHIDGFIVLIPVEQTIKKRNKTQAAQPTICDEPIWVCSFAISAYQRDRGANQPKYFTHMLIRHTPICSYTKNRSTEPINY